MGQARGAVRTCLFGFVAALCWLFPSGASAAVELSFYSKELGVTFPHAFVTLHGSLDATGAPVDEAFGFTAKAVTPAILMGSVPGEVLEEEEPYIRASDKQFSIELSDADYDAVRAVVQRWRDRPQPSYNLNSRNCIHFVAEIAAAAGLKVDYPPKLMKRPRSYLVALRQANESLIAAHQLSSATPAAAASAP